MPLLKRPSAVFGRASLLLALVAAAGSPLLVGAVHPPILVAVTSLAFIALGLHIAERAVRGRRIPIPWAILPIVVGLLSAVFHLVPLPLAVRELLAPSATDMLSWLQAAFPPEFQAKVRPVLSLDAAATAQSVVRLLGMLAVVVVVADRCRERVERRFAFRVLLGFGAALFAVSAAHRIVAAENIYGVFPPNGRLPLYGPLINPNHLARAFGIFGLLLVGRGILVRSRSEAALFLSVGGLCLAGVFATVSRGGIVSVVAAGLLGVALYLWAKRTQDEDNRGKEVRANNGPPQLALIVVLVVAAAGILVGVFAWERLAFEAGREISIEGTKLKLISIGLRLLDDHGRVGVGSGAFAFGIPEVIRAGDFGRELTVVFAENIVVETLTTHGILIGGILFILALAVGASLLKHLRVDTAFPIAALMFLVVGELFDFSFEVGFGALLAGIALALALAPSLENMGKKIPAKQVGIAAAALAGVLIGCGYVGIVDDNRAMEQRVLEARGSTREALLYEGMAKHPFNAWFPYALAVTAREKRDASAALKWANRALNLRPTLAGAHVENARVLWAYGKRRQAALEYRLAWENLAGVVVIDEIVKRTTDLELWQRVVPKDHPEHLALLCASVERSRPNEPEAKRAERLAIAQACFDEASKAERATERTKLVGVHLAIQRGDLEGARARLATLGERLPAEERAVLDLKLTALSDGREAARAKAEEYLHRLQVSTPVLRWILEDARNTRDFGTIHATVAQLRHHTSTPKELESLDLVEVDAWLSEGEATKGLRILSVLVRRHPRDTNLLARLADVQRRLGLQSEARRTAKKALEIDPKNRSARATLQNVDVGERNPTSDNPPPRR